MQSARQFNYRALFAFGHDAAACAVSWAGAFWLRYNLEVASASPWLPGMLQTLVWVVPLQAFIFWRFGLYRGIWRYASLPDLKRILLAVGVSALAIPLLLLMLRVQVPVPRSVLTLDPILLVVIMGGARIAYRAWKEHRLYGVWQKEGQPVLVLGAGNAAVNLVKDLARSDQWRVVGLLDDDPGKQQRMLHGLRVLGKVDAVGHWAGALDARHAIIAMPSSSNSAKRHAINLCAEAGLSVMTIPSAVDLMNGRVTLSQIRKVDVEDLLGRDPVTLDDAGLVSLIRGRVIMITGAGGSIGSELCRQVARYQPGLLILFEMSEFALYRIQQEFADAHPGIELVCAIGDVKCATRVNQIMQRYTPYVVFHAAAYKHVPLTEEENAWEAVQNNVKGTLVLARAAVAHQVAKVVLVSTDKAVNPVNVMGASKRLAEMVCQALQSGARTRFAMVRFGNVLASAGSVIPRFHEQIARGGPVTVTHPEILRYFMSIPEAAQLLLQAGLMGAGGEIFVMDMGEPIRIADLARDMIRLSGFTEDEIKIVYTGLRPGEKLYEELLSDEELTLPTPHPKLRIAKARPVERHWLDALEEWLDQDRVLDDAEVRRGMKQWVPEYRTPGRPRLEALPPRSMGA